MAGECAQDIAAGAERMAGARKRRDGMLAARIRAVRLEKHDILALDLRQEREHLRIGRAAPQPIAERHGIIEGKICGRFLHAAEIGAHFLRHRFGDELRIPCQRRINHAPFFHKKQSPPVLHAHPYCSSIKNKRRLRHVSRKLFASYMLSENHPAGFHRGKSVQSFRLSAPSGREAIAAVDRALTCRERELLATILANQCPVLKLHEISPLLVTRETVPMDALAPTA